VGANTGFTAACVLGALSLSLGAANAAEITILANQGAMPGVRELATAFEAQTGHSVIVVREVDETLERRVRDGSADLVTGNPGNIEVFVNDGSVVPGSVTPFVLAELGISVQAGAANPDISTVESYQAALLAAESIGFSRGCSGTNAAAGIERLGLTQQLQDKITRTESGPVTAYLARGEIEFGIQQTNIMVDVPGTDFVGPVPGYLNVACQSDIGVLTASQEPDVAREMIEFMISPEAAPLLRRTHVEPFSQ
jgi:molybdate transport system substrate-binding protein